jgi:hypothetical protein
MADRFKIVPKEYLLAGKCIFTVISDAGEHKTYKINRSDPVYNVEGQPDSGVKWAEAWWCQLLVGPDNTSDYQSFGQVILPKIGTGDAIRLLRKSTMTKDTEAVQVLEVILHYILQEKELPEGIWIQLPSHCGRCGRLLTASKEQNPYFPWYGPECGSKMSILPNK